MNWIKNFVRPKIRGLLGAKRELPENMWIKDPETGQMVFYRDLEANQFVVPGSGYHMRMAPDIRLKSMFDDGEYQTIALPQVPVDPLKFRDERRYLDRLKESKQKTGQDDAVLAGSGTLDGLPVVMAVQDFAFMGGSLGMAAGEAIIVAMRTAVQKHCPVHSLRVIGRRAHAGGHSVADADAAHDARGARIARSRACPMSSC